MGGGDVVPVLYLLSGSDSEVDVEDMTWSGDDACMYVVDHVPRLVRVTVAG